LLSILSRLDPAVDIVVSGHTHQAYVCHAIEPDRSQPLLYTSAGSYGRYLTEIDLQLARDSGRLLTATAHNLLVVNDSAPRVDAGTYVPLAPQPEVAALVQRYDARVNVLKQRPLGRITAAFTRTPAPSGETALGDLVADAQWAATAAPEDGGADLALTNIGGLRTDVSVVSRALTYGDVYAAQPFNNTLVTVTLSGVDLKALLEAQWRDPAQPPRILQVSAGFHYTWSASALPGQHVDAASMRIRNVAVDPKRDYRVTINSFLAQGGDGFRLLRSASQRRESGLLDADVLADYIREHSPLTPSPAVRIERRD
jgi:5'-nucleotidase